MLKVIDIALAQVGYLEKASNSQLDSKTANAGNKNFTKYARDLDAIPGFYNGKKQGFAWCDTMTDWCFVQAYGVENAKKLLCQPDKSLGASCTYSASYYRKAGRFYEKDPKIGDQIFFKSGSSIVHTGLVYNVDSKKVYTVEGNTSGASGVIANGGGVCRKSYDLTYSKIAGYGRPDYSIVGERVGAKVSFSKGTASPGAAKPEMIQVTVPVLKQGAKGKMVKILQMLLTDANSVYACEVDGSFGPATDRAVRLFQKNKGLAVDGSVGPKTWDKLLN